MYHSFFFTFYRLKFCMNFFYPVDVKIDCFIARQVSCTSPWKSTENSPALHGSECWSPYCVLFTVGQRFSRYPHTGWASWWVSPRRQVLVRVRIRAPVVAMWVRAANLLTICGVCVNLRFCNCDQFGGWHDTDDTGVEFVKCLLYVRIATRH